MAKDTQCTTSVGTVSFPSVFHARAMNEGQEAKYEVTLLFEKDNDLEEVKEVIERAIEKKWPGKRPAGLKLPIRDGDEKERPEYHGKWYIKFKSKFPPKVVDENRDPVDEEQRLIYGGCLARVRCEAWCYQHQSGGKGVSLDLLAIQRMGAGEPFGSGGAVDVDECFDAVEDNAEFATEEF